MAITKSAKKAHRASLKKHVFNVARKRAMKATSKEALGDLSTMTLSKAYQAIDKAAKRGVIKPNTASRKKSRLAKALAKSGK